MLAVGSASRDPGINKRKVSFSGKEDDEFSLQERYNKKGICDVNITRDD